MRKDAPPPYAEYATGPPPPGFVPPPQPHPQHSTTVVVTAPIPTPFGQSSVSTMCPYCHSHISTRVESEAATKTHLFALLLCLIGCWPCACIPYCTDSCLTQNHYCPSCKAFLGAYNN